jgi:hypothetical protein
MYVVKINIYHFYALIKHAFLPNILFDTVNSMAFPNPLDPLSRYPNYQTGAAEYGPIPPFGLNPKDPLNLAPNPFSADSKGDPVFNPMMGMGIPGMGMPGMMPGMPMPSPLLGPNFPSKVMIPAPTAAQRVPPFGSFIPPMPSMMPFGGPMNPMMPFGGMPGMQNQPPQYGFFNKDDVNNQLPGPNGSLTQPGPAMPYGYNKFDPANMWPIPDKMTKKERTKMMKKMAKQPQNVYAPYVYDRNQPPPPPPGMFPAFPTAQGFPFSM